MAYVLSSVACYLSNTWLYVQVFKYFCGDITDDGLMRMLRVIKKNLKPARHPDAASADDDDEDDDFINIEEEIDQAETGESDGQTDDSESVVEVEETDHGHSEASDDSDSGMDDDAMFRIDTYLAQMFKEKKNQAGGETAHSQLVLFKLRILSLLEIFLHENPGKYTYTLLISFITSWVSFMFLTLLFSKWYYHTCNKKRLRKQKVPILHFTITFLHKKFKIAMHRTWSLTYDS